MQGDIGRMSVYDIAMAANVEVVNESCLWTEG